MPRTKMSDEERSIRRKAAREKWRLANPEKDRLAKEKYDLANRAARNAKLKAQRAELRLLKPQKTQEEIEAARQAKLQKKREAQKAYVAANPEKITETRRRTTAKHRAARNAEKARWRRENPGKVLALTRKRQLAKIQRTPPWLSDDDYWMMSQAYELAAQRSKLFGFAWHVDHIIPLQGKDVSGLHVPLNLQVIPGSVNSQKGNRMEVV